MNYSRFTNGRERWVKDVKDGVGQGRALARDASPLGGGEGWCGKNVFHFRFAPPGEGYAGG